MKLFRWTLFVLLGLMSLAAPGFAGAESDTTPPELLDFSYTPTSIDVSSGSQDVTVTVRVVDALSGVQDGCVYFYSPSGRQGHAACFGSNERISGDQFDGIYQSTATFPRFSEAGVWYVYAVYASDGVGNYRYYYTTDLAGLGVQTSLQVTGGPDLASPQLVNFSYAPASIDVSSGSKDVTVTVRVADALSGVQDGCVYFYSPSGRQGHAACFGSNERISGDQFDGIYQSTATFPRFSEAGVWYAYAVYASDGVGNYRYYYANDLAGLGFNTSLQVASNPSDGVAPQLLNFSFTPNAMNTSAAAQDVTVTVRVTDALSGVQDGCVYFYSPSGRQGRAACFGSNERISGDQFDGIYQSTATFPRFSEAGVWYAYAVYASDGVSNYRYYYTNDLAAAGFPTRLQNGMSVTSPNGGEAWAIGSAQTIAWTSNALTGNVKVEVSRDGGTSWAPIIGSTPNDGTHAWTVTGPATTQARIRITSLSDPTSADASNANFTIGGGSLTVTSPNGGETWPIGASRAIQWTSTGLTGNVKIEVSRNGGTAWTLINGSTANGGAFNWTVTGPATTQARIRVTSLTDPTVKDTSNANFTIGGGSLTVTTQNGGETWPIGSVQAIQWTSAGLTGNVKIEVSRNGGTAWTLINGNTANSGAFSWTVTGPATTQARIRVTSLTDPTVTDTSNANFTIGGGSLMVTAPNDGEIWPIGSMQAIQWTSTGLTGNVKIEVSRNGGTVWALINGSTPNSGAFGWTVTGPATTQARIRVTSLTATTVIDASHANFTIQ